MNISGNPVKCNCLLRPVAYWLTSVGRVSGRGANWDSARCSTPNFLKDRAIGSVLEEQLICEDSSDAANFRLNPDVKFREVKARPDKVEVSWYVSTNEDVGDFRLELRSKGIPQSTLFMQDVAYNTR